jgi:hypothetical protein
MLLGYTFVVGFHTTNVLYVSYIFERKEKTDNTMANIKMLNKITQSTTHTYKTLVVWNPTTNV